MTWDVPRGRERIAVTGTVQGVGFRPFVWREASARGLAGYVVNTPEGVTLEAEGTAEAIDGLVAALRSPPPPAATVTLTREALAPTGESRILHSRQCDGRDAQRRGAARSRHLRGVLRRNLRPGQPALPLSLHQLHPLRPALFDHHRSALRPAAHHHAPLRHVPGVPGRVREPGRPALPCRAQRLPGLRAATGAVGRGGEATGGARRRALAGRGGAPRRPDRRGQGPRRLPPDGRCPQRGGRAPRSASASTARRSRSR